MNQFSCCVHSSSSGVSNGQDRSTTRTDLVQPSIPEVIVAVVDGDGVGGHFCALAVDRGTFMGPQKGRAAARWTLYMLRRSLAIRDVTPAMEASECDTVT